MPVKRGKPPERKTPLPRGDSELKRTEFPKRATPLRASPSPKLSGTSLSRAARSPKQRKPLPTSRPTRSREEVEARRTVRQRSGGACEICVRQPATNFQHRLPKSGQGGWTASNGIDVCGSGNVSGCHGLIHQRPARAYEMGWSVRRGQDPVTTPVWLGGGREFVLLGLDGSVTPINEIPDEESA